MMKLPSGATDPFFFLSWPSPFYFLRDFFRILICLLSRPVFEILLEVEGGGILEILQLCLEP